MKTTYTVGALAHAAGLPSSTVRYYDRRGLLKPKDRTEGNYRVYDADALERLGFIRAAVSNGFTLEDIESLLAFRDGDVRACREVQDLIQDRLEELRKRADELGRVQVALRALLRRCRASDPLGKCQVIERLRHSSSLTNSRSPRKSRSHKKIRNSRQHGT